MQRHAPVTIGVVAGDDRRATREFLGLVAPLLQRLDNVVLLRDAGALSRHDAWRVVSAPGQLRLVHEAERLPHWNDRIILVEDRVLPSAGWINVLCAALDDGPDLVAPRTNIADGDELLIGIPYRAYDVNARAAYLASVGAEAPRLTPAQRLDGPCIALRRNVLEAAGGIEGLVGTFFDPSRLAKSVLDQGGHLGVCETAYLHHLGGPVRRRDPADNGTPFVSACLIVRDEEHNLERCLSSLEGCADEIVVYDTGSVDRTRDLAAELGAVVIEGYWDDDFSRARNAALSACQGQWILWVDADEAVVCEDRPQLRQHLLNLDSATEGYLVLIDNLRGNDAANNLTHPACRLFRRGCGHWRGRIHEQVFARKGEADLALQVVDLLRISHWGYLQHAVAERGKADRNLRTAFGDLVGDRELEPAARVLSLARSYLYAGRLDEGCELCRMAADTAKRESTKRFALRGLIEGLLAANRGEDALVVIAELRECSSTPVLADIHEGNARLMLEDYEGALQAFAQVEAGIDQDGFEYSADFVVGPKSQALFALGRYDQAADELLRVLREAGGLDAHLGLLVDAIEHAGRNFNEISAAISRTRLRAFLPQLIQLQPEVADRVLEALFSDEPSSRDVLATASQVARRLPIPRQLVWSSRLRGANVASACPLIAASTDLCLPRRDRLLGATAAWRAFGDQRARLSFLAAALEDHDPSTDATLSVEIASIDAGLGSGFAKLHTGATRTAAIDREGARRVLVVSERVSDLRAAAISARLAGLGYLVTLAHPQPAAPSEQLLSWRGVTVRGWMANATPNAATGFIARLYAEERIDVVILTNEATCLAKTVRELLPAAVLAVDLDDSDLADWDLETGSTIDLVLCAADSPAVLAASTTSFAASSPCLFEPPPPAPVELRCGCAVVANFHGEDVPDSFSKVFAPALAHAENLPIVLLGADASEKITEGLPAAIYAGPVADPRNWLAAVRAVVVIGQHACAHWLDVAAMCATPAFILPESETEARRLVDALGALCASDELFDAFAPAPPPAFIDDLVDPIAAALQAKFEELTRSPGSGTNEVRVVGGVFSLDSLAQVNRELLCHLAALEVPYRLSVQTGETRPFPPAGVAALSGVEVHHRDEQLEPAAIEIRHQWPPDFAPTASERLVLIQPWEFGGLPAEWIGPLRDVVDELWVPSRFVAESALASGVPINKVYVVPNGVDAERFRPEGPRYPLSSTAATKFLFVGGLIERKGVDALIETYLSAFRADDDVCLVIKPYGSQSVYRNSTLEPVLRRVAEGAGPAIEIVDETLDIADLAALYRSCDVLVHPYRGEGFGLPIAEAMASGLPVIVPDAGAARDFCDEEVAWLVPTRKVPISPSEWTPSVGGAWWREPSRTGLAEKMREAASDPAMRAAKGAAGRARIVEHFSWEHAARIAAERIEALAGGRQIAEKISA